mgnify:FL=1
MNGPDHNYWENDPVWTLVDEANASEAGPFFVRNVMREVRLASDEAPSHWWQHLLTPKPILAGSLGAIAVAILIAVNSGNPDKPNDLVIEPAPTTPQVQLDDLVKEELLAQAAEDPTRFTDEALMALLY